MTQAVVLTCPICGQQRPYDGASEAELGEVRLGMGADRHLDSHDLDEDEQALKRIEIVESGEVRNVSRNICEKADNRGWGDYGL